MYRAVCFWDVSFCSCSSPLNIVVLLLAGVGSMPEFVYICIYCYTFCGLMLCFSPIILLLPVSLSLSLSPIVGDRFFGIKCVY